MHDALSGAGFFHQPGEIFRFSGIDGKLCFTIAGEGGSGPDKVASFTFGTQLFCECRTDTGVVRKDEPTRASSRDSTAGGAAIPCHDYDLPFVAAGAHFIGDGDGFRESRLCEKFQPLWAIEQRIIRPQVSVFEAPPALGEANHQIDPAKGRSAFDQHQQTVRR